VQDQIFLCVCVNSWKTVSSFSSFLNSGVIIINTALIIINTGVIIINFWGTTINIWGDNYKYLEW
jgi:hypothetical protein